MTANFAIHPRTIAYANPEEISMTTLAPDHRAMLSTWQQHTQAEFALKDADAAAATMTANPYVLFIPTGTGGTGREAVRDFYANHFLPSIPPDFERLPDRSVCLKGCSREVSRLSTARRSSTSVCAAECSTHSLCCGIGIGPWTGRARRPATPIRRRSRRHSGVILACGRST